jgi:folate-binding Fe-S cluster repair protein YgfZ
MSEGYDALRQGAAWLNLDSRGRIAVRGRDRARLLHAITSNEVKKMAPGDSCYAFLLNPQGRIQADLHLLCLADHFLVDTDPSLREKVLQHIRRYSLKISPRRRRLSASKDRRLRSWNSRPARRPWLPLQ